MTTKICKMQFRVCILKLCEHKFWKYIFLLIYKIGVFSHKSDTVAISYLDIDNNIKLCIFHHFKIILMESLYLLH